MAKAKAPKTESTRKYHRNGDLLVNPDSLRRMIIKHDLSIMEAGLRFDIDEFRARGLLFKRKPTQEDIAKGVAVYEDGKSFKIACVASGVSEPVLKAALRKRRREKMVKTNW